MGGFNLTDGIDNVTLENACKITWNPNGTVHSFGPIVRGQFEGNPDIAGLGLLIYFLVGPVFCLIGAAFVAWEFSKREVFDRVENRFRQTPSQPKYIVWLKGLSAPPVDQGRGVKALRALLRATADALTVITLSYVLNFGITGKCTMSGYHYIFGINTMLIAFASITLYVTIVRDYWAAPVSAFLRTAAHVVVFSLIGRLLFYQWTVSIMPEPIYTVTKAYGKNDSALFLPMACFLDYDLNPLIKLNSTQRETVGHWDHTKRLMEPIVFILLSVCFVLAHLAHLAHARRRYSSQEPETPANPPDPEAAKDMSGNDDYALFARIFYFLIVLVCMAANGICYAHILILRSWVLSSGWMETEPGSDQSNEEDLVGIGQLGYLCTFFWIILLFFDELRCCCCCCFSRKDPKRKR